MAKLTLQLGVGGQSAVKGALGDIRHEASALDKVFDGLKGAGSGLLTGLGKIGLAGMGIDTLAGAARGLGDALGIGLNSELEDTRAKLMAFTKDAGATDKMLADLKAEAKSTPFAFKDLASATASLLPASKTAGVGLDGLMKQAQLLAALNPGEGLEGAAFSLKEALSGDFLSIVERFNLPKQRLQELKEAGVPALEAVSTALSEMGVDASLVANMGTTMTGRWSTFMDTIDGIKQTAGAGLFDAMKEGLGGLQTLLDENMPSIEAFAAGLGSLIGQGATLAVQGLLKIGEMVGPLLAKLPEFGAALGQAFGFFTTGAGDVEKFRGVLNSLLGPTGAQGVMEVFTNLSGFVRETVIPMFQSFGTIVGKVMSGDLGGALQAAGTHITTFGPKLLTTLGEWGQRFLQWVGPMIPPLLGELGKLAGQMFGWIGEQAPGLLQTFVTKWVPSAVNWLLDAAIDIGPKLGSFLSGVLDWLIENGPSLAKTFITEWIPAALGWVWEAAKQIGPKLYEFLVGIGTWIQNEGAPKLGILMNKMGWAIIDGIVEGAKAVGHKIGGAITGIANDAVAAAKKALGISSPSKLTRDQLGIPLGQGIIQGIKHQGPALDNALSGVLTDAVTGAEKGTGKLGNTLKEALAGSQMGRGLRNVGDLAGGLDDILDRVNRLNIAIPEMGNNLIGLPSLPPLPGGGGNNLQPLGAGGSGVTITINNTNDMRGMSQDQATRAVADPLAQQVKRYVMSGAF